MVAPHGSIPGYKPGPILNGPRKAFVSSLFLIPAAGYIYIRQRQVNEEKNRRLLEEEGRRNWMAGGGGVTQPRNMSGNGGNSSRTV